MYQSDSDTAAARPKAEPSRTASCNGPFARAANDAAAPSAIAQPFGFSQSRPAPPRKLVGTPMLAFMFGCPLLAIFQANQSK